MVFLGDLIQIENPCFFPLFLPLLAFAVTGKDGPKPMWNLMLIYFLLSIRYLWLPMNAV